MYLNGGFFRSQVLSFILLSFSHFAISFFVFLPVSSVGLAFSWLFPSPEVPPNVYPHIAVPLGTGKTSHHSSHVEPGRL